MKRLLIILVPLLVSACSLIDDDLSVCGESMLLDYQLQLHTELSMQLQTELVTEQEAPVRQAIENWLAPIFTDHAKDIDLRFFSSENDEISKYIHDVINDNRTSYTIYLPSMNYMHLAVANIEDDSQVLLSGGEHSQTMKLTLSSDELQSLKTGVFSARLPMDVNDKTTHFDVHLYMVSAAVVLVIDETNCPDIISMVGQMDGSAESFSVRDSVYNFSHPRTIKMEGIGVQSSEASMPRKGMIAASSPYRCMGAVAFPTENDSTWSVTAVATLSDNRHTTTTLTLENSLKAGTLRIVRCAMKANGEVVPITNTDVGASVELDWDEGGGFEIEL